MNKTNAARLLDALSIQYELSEYEVDESDLSAESVADKLNLDPEQVFKTLVLRGDRNGIFICVVPGNMEIDLKLAAKASGNKSAAMIAVKEILDITGYIRGGCSPVGMKKKYPTYIDEYCTLYDKIFVSAGIRGLQLKLAPTDLIAATGAQISNLVTE